MPLSCYQNLYQPIAQAAHEMKKKAGLTQATLESNQHADKPGSCWQAQGTCKSRCTWLFNSPVAMGYWSDGNQKSGDEKPTEQMNKTCFFIVG